MIYPTTKRHYTGGYTKEDKHGRRWVFIKATKDRPYWGKYAADVQEAVDLLREKNIELGLPIKNLIHEVEDYYEVELTSGKRMKFDVEDLELVQSYLLCFNSGYAVASKQGQKKIKFHNILMNHEPGEFTVDHINRDPLDNRRANLRLATKSEQMRNRGLMKSCSSGHRYVYPFIKKRDNIKYWCVDINGKHRKIFSTKKWGEDTAKQMAIDYVNSVLQPGE